MFRFEAPFVRAIPRNCAILAHWLRQLGPSFRGPAEAGVAPGSLKVIYRKCLACIQRVSRETPKALPGLKHMFGLRN